MKGTWAVKVSGNWRIVFDFKEGCAYHVNYRDYHEENEEMRTRPPTHPDGILKRHYLEPLNLTVSALAKSLGVSRKTMSRIVNEHGSITPDMALRLSKAFNTTPQLWLNLQQNYDLWHASRASYDWKRVETIAI